MKRIIIAHGWDGASDADWMPWATLELSKLGFEVHCPDFPHSERPTIEDWVPFLSHVVGTPDADTYFIAHSIGCQTVLRYLETIDVKIGGAFFVAGWFGLDNLEDDESKEIAKPWIERPIDLAKVRGNLGFSTAIFSDNDPWVPYEGTKEKYEKLLGSEIITLQGAGHVTSHDGFGPFPQLIEEVKRKIKNI